MYRDTCKRIQKISKAKDTCRWKVYPYANLSGLHLKFKSYDMSTAVHMGFSVA